MTGGPGPLVSARLSAEASPAFQPLRVNEIAILPFNSETSLALDLSSAEILTKALIEAFDSQTSLKIVNAVSNSRVDRVLAGLGTKTNKSAERAVSFGKALAVQAVLYGSVSRYSGDRPKDADVSFQLWLVEPLSGEVFWTATYAMANKPLSENLFRFKEALEQGMAFEDRRILMNKGFKQAAVELEKLRHSTE